MDRVRTSRSSAARGAGTIGATCAVAGSALLLVGTWLHPLDADPNDALAAFTEYAADRLWYASHLMQLAGVAAIVAALLLLGRRLDVGRGALWSRLAAAGAVASLASAAALQAVDGVALKRMVDAWAAASMPEKAAWFAAAFAVRQVEIGLASMASLVFGATAALYGVALLVDGRHPAWLGAVAVAGGAATVVAGVVIATTGFSALAMAIDMPATLLLLAWLLLIARRMWRDGAPSFEPGDPLERSAREDAS